MFFKKIIKLIFVFCLGLTIVLLFLFIHLPRILESQIQKRVPPFLDPDEVAFDIQKAGLFNTFVSNIRVCRGLSIDSINIDYAVKGMSSIHLRRVTVSGLIIRASLDENNQIKIHGLALPGTSTGQARQPDPAFLSFLPEKIVVQNSKMVLTVLNDEVLIPLDFSLESSSPQKKWKFNLSRISFAKPFETAVEDLSSTVLIDNQKINAFGFFNISCSHLPSTRMEYELNLDLKEGYQFDATLKNSPVKECQIAYESMLATLQKPQLTVRFNGTPSKSKGEITLDLEHGRIQHQKESLVFSDLKIRSDMVADITGDGNKLSSASALTADNVRIQSDLMDTGFPSAGVSGWFRLDKNNVPSLSMVLKAEKGNITSEIFKTKASGISLDIPIQYPDITGKTYGTYVVPVISYDNQYTFSTSGKILQTDLKEFRINGGVKFKTLPGLNTQFASVVGFEKALRASMEFKTNPVKLNSADIKKLIPQPIQAADIDMTVSAKGKADYINHKLNTSMQVRINDGKIYLPDINFTATGINTTVDLNDLPAVKSVPGQVLTVDAIDADKIKIKDARVRFSLEDAGSLLIENLRFKWCDGLVSSESIRIPQANNVYALTLYCDRLELTQLLKQMGAFNAQGTGTLNGRIPVFYSDGNISFDNGFLFSTPGNGGKVVIENARKITAGIPMDSPQFAQLDLAQEALKDFDYNWAKLIFNTFEDTLSVNMELDGKPSKILPFEYRKEFGGFVRVDASSPGSRFQGIKLDVNLKLPFNDVMKFGNKLKSILK